MIYPALNRLTHWKQISPPAVYVYNIWRYYYSVYDGIYFLVTVMNNCSTLSHDEAAIVKEQVDKVEQTISSLGNLKLQKEDFINLKAMCIFKAGNYPPCVWSYLELSLQWGFYIVSLKQFCMLYDIQVYYTVWVKLIQYTGLNTVAKVCGRVVLRQSLCPVVERTIVMH